jgi:hypothetical protein
MEGRGGVEAQNEVVEGLKPCCGSGYGHIYIILQDADFYPRM